MIHLLFIPPKILLLCLAVAGYVGKLLCDLFKSSPQRLLVLGMQESGKTTLNNNLRGKETKEYTQTATMHTLEECEIEYQGKKITLGEGKDIPGDIEEHISLLNGDLEKFFKGCSDGLIIYLVNCRDLENSKLIAHAGRTLTVCLKKFRSPNLAIIYSHCDEVGKGEKDLADVRKDFLSKLSQDYPTVAGELRNKMHYILNLTDRENVQSTLCQIFEKIKK